MKFLRKLFAGFRSGISAAAASKSPAEVMREMRNKWLTRVPKQGDYELDDDVVAVLMEWPLGEKTATVLASAKGDASLYTTSSFGIIGGSGHEHVRKAARHFITCAQTFLYLAIPTTVFPYPDSHTLQVYFVTPKGVRAVSFSMDEVEIEKSPARALFSYGQEVLTQLRLSSPDLRKK